MNEEFLVDVGHQPASITSLPFVHTARRYYRLNALMSVMDGGLALGLQCLSTENQANLSI